MFGHVACHVTIIKREGKRKPQYILLGKKIHLVLGLLVRDIAIYSYAQNTPLTQALNPFSYYDSIKQFYPNSESACEWSVWVCVSVWSSKVFRALKEKLSSCTFLWFSVFMTLCELVQDSLLRPVLGSSSPIVQVGQVFLSHEIYGSHQCYARHRKYHIYIHLTLGSITSRCSGKWPRTHPPEGALSLGRIKDRTRETAEIEPKTKLLHSKFNLVKKFDNKLMKWLLARIQTFYSINFVVLLLKTIYVSNSLCIKMYKLRGLNIFIVWWSWKGALSSESKYQ